jgi:hypothetical protein
MAKTAWKDGIRGKYVKIAKDDYLDISLEYINRITIATETLTQAETTVVSGDCDVLTTLSYDRATYGTNYHRVIVNITPNTTGIHTLKTTTTTTAGRVFVHTYDIRTDT